jgi:hypothetical protein
MLYELVHPGSTGIPARHERSPQREYQQAASHNYQERAGARLRAGMPALPAKYICKPL